MAVSAIDEAMRNAVAVGADPDRIAILDNFCWGNPTYPDRLGALVRACQGCYDGATAYGTPFISGKDSLYNEFNGEPIPGTLLISAIGVVPEMGRVVTSDLKRAGDRLYLLGETRGELGGSLLYHALGIEGGDPPAMPHDPLTRYRLLHQAIRHGLVRACHDLSEGGLAVALAEMALAGRLGVSATLPETRLTPLDFLFSESNGRLLMEVAPEDVAALEAHFQGQALIPLGRVTDDGRLTVLGGRGDDGGETVIDAPVHDLVKAWKREGGA
jgi:phosphoribosylformylglycinamidine synthase